MTLHDEHDPDVFWTILAGNDLDVSSDRVRRAQERSRIFAPSTATSSSNGRPRSVTVSVGQLPNRSSRCSSNGTHKLTGSRYRTRNQIPCLASIDRLTLVCSSPGTVVLPMWDEETRPGGFGRTVRCFDLENTLVTIGCVPQY
ncbi:hypothetical protein D8Y22_12915 [Salinadaptatus halalkaliphilus]|uniref:Uncharacterized protein n=1 Tax=Salinadaptatus halalkaliphilus TaxID=2419781 RepID=A0A4S3TN69_9EURY|nr:hypothetical protein D8Y22_12915 [Salinadaptatus halalkaliphilus]